VVSSLPTYNHPSRPKGVTLLVVVVLSFAAFYLVRFVDALVNWKFLTEILPFSPAYLAVSGLVWFAAEVVLAWGLWRGRSWSRPLYWLILLGFSLYFWLDRFFMPGYPQRNANWLFVLISEIVLSLLSLVVLHHRKANLYFGE
jgi:hypothetical protein